MTTRLLPDSEDLTYFSAKAPTVLDNLNCLYCSAELTDANRTKEHVVGRRFVPRGKLQGSWNLIGYACSTCNNHKSRLEDEVAAVSMQPTVDGKFAVDDATLRTEAARKAANSYSSKTRRPVAESNTTIELTSKHPTGMKMTVSLVGPAQISSDVVHELCRLQVCGFFYMLTFDAHLCKGKFWRGTFMPVERANKSDWGSARLRSFALAVKAWEPRLMSTDAIADGFYKIAIRKHPSAECWSWAVEWNHFVRCVGFFGEEQACSDAESKLTQNQGHLVVDTPNRKLTYRRNEPLNESDDVLFQYEPT